MKILFQLILEKSCISDIYYGLMLPFQYTEV